MISSSGSSCCCSCWIMMLVLCCIPRTSILPTTQALWISTSSTRNRHLPRRSFFKDDVCSPKIQWQQQPQKRKHPFSLESRLPNGDIDTAAATTDTSTSDLNINMLSGVVEFETWFDALCQQQKNNKPYCAPSIQHAVFGTTTTSSSIMSSYLRGLSCSGTERGTVMTIPQSIVLSSKSNSSNDWDTQLAIQLWKECLLGKQSKLYGYCALLTLGTMDTTNKTLVPPSTAPNALRHWTKEQLQQLLLLSSPTPTHDNDNPNHNDVASLSYDNTRGQELVQLVEKQKQQWKAKYEACMVLYQQNQQQEEQKRKSSFFMTWEQFQWAMEVVHSRAFRGNDTFMWLSKVKDDSSNENNTDEQDHDTLKKISLLGSIMAPILSAILGYTFLQSPNALDPSSNIILLALAGMGTLPLVINTMNQSNSSNNNNNDNNVVVLLPLIDSANHDSNADSQIDYNPLTQSFSLSVGSKCCIKDQNDTLTQLFISYGKKSDQELLLNYGFLPNDNDDDDNDNHPNSEDHRVPVVSEVDQRNQERRHLAKAFRKRNCATRGT